MRKLFVFEAGLISFAGAVVGIGIAMIAGAIVNTVINMGAASRGVTESFDLFLTPAWAILGVIAATIVIGLLVVYIPARRAEHINPIDALRRE